MWAWLGSSITALLASSVARFTAMKIIISVLVLTALPIILNNVIYKIIEILLQIINQNTGSMTSAVAQFSGLSGWMLSNLSIPEGISIFLSAVAIKYTLGLIPFVRA